ncbi:MAG: hypothetical protein ACREP9_15220 [Candidatus Dormibacteraceae bacterium]
MPKNKKPTRGKKTAPKKKPVARKKLAARKKLFAKKKAVGKSKAATQNRILARKKAFARKKAHTRKKPTPRKRPSSGSIATFNLDEALRTHPDPGAAGQSGDIQGLREVAEVDSESVEELMEEGQAFEAEVISGVENAPNADQSEVTTKEVSEDDVPPEYQDPD